MSLPNRWALLWQQSNTICKAPAFAPQNNALVSAIAGLIREMAMSELRQQTIALWILLMLLILVVPLALE
jgi:Na+/H+-translocating membrane pyrophosphatase